jgi:hypothetical protein
MHLSHDMDQLDYMMNRMEIEDDYTDEDNSCNFSKSIDSIFEQSFSAAENNNINLLLQLTSTLSITLNSNLSSVKNCNIDYLKWSAETLLGVILSNFNINSNLGSIGLFAKQHILNNMKNIFIMLGININFRTLQFLA